MKTFKDLELDVLQWADSRGILGSSDAKTQCLKFASEAGELCDAVAKGRHLDTIDGIGDVMVTLIILADMSRLSILPCLNAAFEVISKRKGEMRNGVFIKAAEPREEESDDDHQ